MGNGILAGSKFTVKYKGDQIWKIEFVTNAKEKLKKTREYI